MTGAPYKVYLHFPGFEHELHIVPDAASFADAVVQAELLAAGRELRSLEVALAVSVGTAA